MLGNKREYEVMATYESTHWWYRSLHALCLRHLKQFSSVKNPHILDCACGTGGLMLYLKNHGYQFLKGFDLSEDAVDYCNAANLDVRQGDLKKMNKYENSSFDVMICNDGLYFLDEAEIQKFAMEAERILKSDGILLLNLPAFAIFRGTHDEVVGIRKRFTMDSVNRLFRDSALEKQEYRYWPLTVSPVIATVRFVQRLKMKYMPSTPSSSDISSSGSMINRLLEVLIKAEFMLIRNRIFGSSLHIVYQKK